MHSRLVSSVDGASVRTSLQEVGEAESWWKERKSAGAAAGGEIIRKDVSADGWSYYYRDCWARGWVL